MPVDLPSHECGLFGLTEGGPCLLSAAFSNSASFDSSLSEPNSVCLSMMGGSGWPGTDMYAQSAFFRRKWPPIGSRSPVTETQRPTDFVNSPNTISPGIDSASPRVDRKPSGNRPATRSPRVRRSCTGEAMNTTELNLMPSVPESAAPPHPSQWCAAPRSVKAAKLWQMIDMFKSAELTRSSRALMLSKPSSTICCSCAM